MKTLLLTESEAETINLFNTWVTLFFGAGTFSLSIAATIWLAAWVGADAAADVSDVMVKLVAPFAVAVGFVFFVAAFVARRNHNSHLERVRRETRELRS